jgi:hypothetical protein
MDRTIVIIAPDNDTHASVIKRVLDTDFATEAVIWDTSHLPANDFLTFRPQASDGLLRLNLSGRVLRSGDIHSIWWRRPNGFNLSKDICDEKVARFCTNEYSALLHGALASLTIPIVNTPHAESLANRKPFQLTMAQKSGLDTPNTLISNDPGQVRAFWEENHRDCIYKTLTPISDRFCETRRLIEEDLSHLDKLCHAPIIVQERIQGFDVRINVIGSQVFAASVKTNIREAQTDWRLDLACKWEEYELNSNVKFALRSLLSELGLHYGCIDMRVQPDGRNVFLEVNPSGQFLFVEIDTGQPLVNAFSNLLLHPESAWAAETSPS